MHPHFQREYKAFTLTTHILSHIVLVLYSPSRAWLFSKIGHRQRRHHSIAFSILYLWKLFAQYNSGIVILWQRFHSTFPLACNIHPVPILPYRVAGPSLIFISRGIPLADLFALLKNRPQPVLWGPAQPGATHFFALPTISHFLKSNIALYTLYKGATQWPNREVRYHPLTRHKTKNLKKVFIQPFQDGRDEFLLVSHITLSGIRVAESLGTPEVSTMGDW